MSSQNENHPSELQSFTYFISQKGAILVASLAGLCEDEAVELFLECKTEIENKLGEIQGLVLDLSGLTGIANEIVPLWAQLQSAIRSHEIEFRLCGIEETVKEKLHRLGVLRLTEIAPSLKDALPEIVTLMRKNSRLKSQSPANKKAA